MPTTPISFNKGTLANLPSAKTAGALYFVTDERAIYLDVSSSNRIRIGDFQEFATVADLEANQNPSTSALYYITSVNCLAKWDGSGYVQINLDTGATSIEVTGVGNAITAASYSALTRKITLTKGATYLTASDVDDIISNLDLDDTYYDKTAGEEVATAVDNILDGTNIDSFSDVETALGGKVSSVAAGDDSVSIGGTATAPTIAVAIDDTVGNNLELVAGKGLRVEVPSGAEYTITKQATADTGFFATYQLFKNATAVGDKINVPKDYLVKSASIETVTTANQPYSGAVVGDKYIDFVVNVKEGTATSEHIYLPVNELVDVYTAGNGIDLSNTNAFSVKINNNSANGLSATSAGLQMALASNSTTGAITSTDYNKLHTHSNKALLDTYTQTEANLADAVSKKHTHSNKSVLDGISAEDVASWGSEVGAMDAIDAILNGTNIDSFADVEAALALKAPLASPALTGTPTAPTATAGTNTTQIATTAFVTEAVSHATVEWVDF